MGLFDLRILKSTDQNVTLPRLSLIFVNKKNLSKIFLKSIEFLKLVLFITIWRAATAVALFRVLLDRGKFSLCPTIPQMTPLFTNIHFTQNPKKKIMICQHFNIIFITSLEKFHSSYTRIFGPSRYLIFFFLHTVLAKKDVWPLLGHD